MEVRKLDNRERGEGMMKIVISLAIIAYLGFCAVKISVAKADDRAVQSKTEEVLKFAGTNRWDIDDMEFQIGNICEEYKLGVDPDDITVVVDGADFRTTFEYDRSIPLGPYTHKKHVVIDARWASY